MWKRCWLIKPKFDCIWKYPSFQPGGGKKTQNTMQLRRWYTSKHKDEEDNREKIAR